MAAGAALSIDVVTCCCSTLASGSRVRRRSELARVHAKTSRQLSRGACQGGVRRVAQLEVTDGESCSRYTRNSLWQPGRQQEKIS